MRQRLGRLLRLVRLVIGFRNHARKFRIRHVDVPIPLGSVVASVGGFIVGDLPGFLGLPLLVYNQFWWLAEFFQQLLRTVHPTAGGLPPQFGRDLARFLHRSAGKACEEEIFDRLPSVPR